MNAVGVLVALAVRRLAPGRHHRHLYRALGVAWLRLYVDLTSTAEAVRDVSANGARAEGDSAHMRRREVRGMRICRWCGGGYLAGLYWAHLSGRTHGDWRREERRRRAAWRQIAAYRAELAWLRGRD